MQIFCGIAQSENESFEKLFSILQANTPIIASVSISGGIWFVYGYVYNNRGYGFLHGTRWDGKVHELICNN